MSRTSPVFRVITVSARDQVSRYWKTAALLAMTLAAGVGLALPTVSLHGRLALQPLRGGDLGLLLGASLATLGIAVVTILILSLAREAERSPEVSVRRAVGAGHRVLLGSALLEGIFLAGAGLAAGGILGALIASSAAPWPGVLRPGTLSPVWAAPAVLVAVVIAGASFPVLFPRRRISEAEPHRPTPLMPSAIQIGATLIALTMGTLLSRHAADITGSRVAGPTDDAVYSIAVPDTAPAERARRYANLLHALSAVGAAQASLTSPGALLGLGSIGAVTTDCGDCSEGGLPIRWRVKPATHQFVTADTFQMLGVRVVEGRGITSGDGWETPRVAVINRSLAAREFQYGQAIGRLIRVVDDGEEWSTVVGVVDEPSATGLGGAIQPRYAVYLSVLQHPPSQVDLLVRTADPSGRSVASAGRAALGPRALDPAPATVRELVGAQAAPLRWFAHRFGLQGWGMLAIAMVGALAVTRLWVTSLLGELGVRRALGARRSRIVSHVLLRAGAVGAAGIAGGIWFGGAIWSMLADLVPGLDPWDTGLVVRLGLLLLATTLLGALPPALRASRATPSSLLSAS